MSNWTTDTVCPPKDIPILAGAVASHCAVLLTGDIADFGHVIASTWQGVRILTVSELLSEMGDRGG